jgi:hypothetical protein
MDVGSGGESALCRLGIESKPLTCRLHQFPQGLEAGIAVAVLVGRHNRLGRPCPSSQLGLGQPGTTSNRLDQGCRRHSITIADCICERSAT